LRFGSGGGELELRDGSVLVLAGAVVLTFRQAAG
jgi:hypothetical protein